MTRSRAATRPPRERRATRLGIRSRSALLESNRFRRFTLDCGAADRRRVAGNDLSERRGARELVNAIRLLTASEDDWTVSDRCIGRY